MSIALEELAIGLLQQDLALTQQIQSQLQFNRIVDALNYITSELDFIHSQIDDPVFGLEPLQAQLATFQATTALDVTAILAAIAAAQQTGSPVTLPTTPPTGYGFDPVGDTASIWGFIDSQTSQPTITLVSVAYSEATAREGQTSIDQRRSPYFDVFQEGIANYDQGYPSWYPPKFDTSALSRSDTVLSILAASNPTITFTLMPDAQHYRYVGLGPTNVTVICRVDDAWLAALKDSVLGPLTSIGAPIWPGLTGVTLLTPVAIATTLTITEVCSGCIVTILGVPTKQGQFLLGDLVSWRNAGALAFVDDNGEAEYPQNLGFEDAVYLPKSMVSASAIVLRASPGVTGTVTPFTIP